ncbi:MULTISPECIES: hypothetical protein [Bacillus]|uniref:hypothetical protein n=1 Tax=Bacillus TaxID=1386 RepID=UPI00053578C6|nr:hypothetical protein [Bacillus pseudomycoides]MED1599255.1 hypothetical protein [Bacillus pseudomycoides]MED4714613.1 hypothetical protein [Bacillus pseudomycoides]OOR48387.1 hypothetical protein BLX05_29735 [Bacillus pseudomycoides]PDY08280.1 hypothetical protein COO16_30155 [Bacillus pseudomycoides]PEF73240.1 hypothetical protein CON94_21955 [Bacillus pseudomycoides]
MQTISLKQANIKTTSKALGIYPKSLTPDNQLPKTIGIQLSSKQAIDLATKLLVAAQDWDEVRITAFRRDNSITITTKQSKI